MGDICSIFKLWNLVAEPLMALFVYEKNLYNLTHNIHFSVRKIQVFSYTNIISQKTRFIARFKLVFYNFFKIYTNDHYNSLIIFRIGSINVGDTDSSSIPIFINVSVRLKSAPSSPQIPTQQPSLWPLSMTI